MGKGRELYLNSNKIGGGRSKQEPVIEGFLELVIAWELVLYIMGSYGQFRLNLHLCNHSYTVRID